MNIESIYSSHIAEVLTSNVAPLNAHVSLENNAPFASGVRTAQPLVNKSFGSFLVQSIDEVDSKAEVSQKTMQRFLATQDVPLHHVLMQLEENTLMLQLMTQVRNKLVESYQEISRMQV